MVLIRKVGWKVKTSGRQAAISIFDSKVKSRPCNKIAPHCTWKFCKCAMRILGVNDVSSLPIHVANNGGDLTCARSAAHSTDHWFPNDFPSLRGFSFPVSSQSQ